jgi:hypothetical protein
VDQDGKLIALNFYHPRHGYVTLTTADPFPESERYNPSTVRAYRAALATLTGCGLVFDNAITERENFLLEDAIPRTRLTFANSSPCIMRLKQTAHFLKPISLKPGLLSLDTGLHGRMLSSLKYHSKPFTHEYAF